MNKKIYKILLTITIVIAIIFKIVIIQKTPINDSTQIDARIGYPKTVEDYDNLYSNFAGDVHGHFYYIMYIYTNHTLCDDTEGQTYHPPLHYIISATWLTIMDFTNLDSMQKIESLQYIGLIYFIISLVIAYKILQELELSDKVKLLAIMLFSFYPKFTKLALLITNDFLLFIFSMLSLLYLIKWIKNSNIKNAFILGLVMGIGSLVKANIVVMIIPIGIAFLVKFFRSMKDGKKFTNIYVQGMVFGAIFVILTLAYYARCLVILGDYKIAVPLESLYIGDASFLEKWGIKFSEIIFLNNQYSKNIWTGFFWTSLVKNKNIMLSLVGISNIVIIIYMLYTIIKHIKTKNNINLILILTFFSQILAYVCYNIKNPYYCTVDTRYVPIAIFLRITFFSNEYRFNR